MDDENHHAHGKLWPFLINDALAASDFVKTYPNCIERAGVSGTTIAHTRLPTAGDPKFARNNHPIRYGQVTLVHNGCVDNDDWLFKVHDLPRYAEVDTEIIPAMLDFHLKDTEPHSEVRMKQIGAALEQIEGSMAIAFFVDDEPHTLYLAKGYSSPLVTARLESGITVFASTRGALLDAAKPFGTMSLYDEVTDHHNGTILRIDQSGRIEMAEFTPDPGFSRSWRDYNGYHWSSMPTSTKALPKANELSLAPAVQDMLTTRRSVAPEMSKTAPDWADDTMDPTLLEAPTTLNEIMAFFTPDDLLGMFSYWEQDVAMRRMASDFFQYPPILADQPRCAYVQPVIDGVIEYVIEWLFNDKDKRKWDDVASFLGRSKFYLRPGDKVQVTVRGSVEKRDGWIVACPQEFPNGYYVVAVNLLGDTVLVRRQYHALDVERTPDHMVEAVMDHALLVAEEQGSTTSEPKVVPPLHLWPTD